MNVSVFRSVMIPPFSWCFANRVDDSYAVVSEFYGRGLFNKVTVITESAQESPSAPAPAPAPAPTPAPVPALQTYGPGAEAKLRLQEGQSKQMYVPTAAKQMAPKGTSIVPIPEGRMRVMEQNLYSSSLEANISRLEPVHAKTLPIRKIEKPISAEVSPKITAAITNGAKSKNPFEEENYDEAKNPFADDDTTNPFSDDEEYDKNLNPFS